MKKRFLLKISVLILASHVLCWPAALASDDFQYWSRFTLKTWEKDSLSLSTYGDLRLMEDASDARLYLISEQLAYRWLENLDLGANYTYIESKTKLISGENEFKYQHRLELEVNPHWNVSDWLKIKNRNRAEFRWIEDQGSNTRFRHLWELEFPLKNRLPIQSFYLNNEFFYDFNKGEYSENRAIPAGIKVKISDHVMLRFFYMIQSRKGITDWSSNQVVGTHFIFSF